MSDEAQGQVDPTSNRLAKVASTAHGPLAIGASILLMAFMFAFALLVMRARVIKRFVSNP